MSQRSRVIILYKTFTFSIADGFRSLQKLLHLGKDWPQGYQLFRTKLHGVFFRNKDVKEPEKVEAMIAHGQFVVKEIEALYMLKKYRTLKRRYYND